MYKEELFLSINELVIAVSDKVSGKKNPHIPYVGLEHIAPNEPFLITTAPSDTSISINSVFKKGDILFGKLRPNLRKSLPAPFDGYCSTDILVLRARPGISPEFAAKVLQSDAVFRAVVRTSEGTKMPRTSWNKLKILSVFVPKLLEQRILFRIIDTLDTQIQQTEQLVAKLKQIKIGLLHDLLTRGIDENGDVRDPVEHPEEFKKSVVGKIPKEWKILQVKGAGAVQLGRQRSPRHQTGRHTTPYLRVANVFDGWIDYSDVLQMDFTSEEREAYNLIPGDILLNEGQSLELVGRSAIYKGPPNIYCFQNTLVRFRCNSQVIPEYCQAVFKYWLDTRKFTTIAKQTTSVAHLGADRFAKMSLFVPSIDEQCRIVTILNAQDTRLSTEESHLAKLKQLKNGLMHDLLTGRVRVTQLISESEECNV